MFYVLITAGILILVLGLYIDKNNISEYPIALDKKNEYREMEYLEDRVSELEKTLFSHSLEIERYKNKNIEDVNLEEKVENIEGENSKTIISEKLKIQGKIETRGNIREQLHKDKNRENKKNESILKYEMIREYEKDGKSIDEISKEMNMNKGEVLLLKKLYKNY